ncbi:hypothetical protein [Brevundimonas alba]|nr:hypothetical protein [Brevundimonas alba]
MVSRFRRRLSLLASTALVAAGSSVLLFAPTTARAGDECGNPAANGNLSDVLICLPGVFPTGIDYTTTVDGNFALLLRDAVQTGDGIRVTGGAGESLTVQTQTVTLDDGDLSIVSAADGIRVESPDSNILIDLTDGDAGDVALQIIASNSGIVAGGGSGDVDIVLTTGSISALTGNGILAGTTGSGSISIDMGDADIVALNVGISAVTVDGDIDILAGSDITGAFGIAAMTTGTGSVSLATSGSVITSSAGSAISITSGGSVTINNSSALNATGGAGMLIAGATGVTIVNSGTIAGTAIHGLYADLTTSATGDVSITNTGDIGSLADRVDSVGVAGLITNTANTGSVTIRTDGDIYANGAGVIGVGRSDGDVTLLIGMNSPSTVVGVNNYGVAAEILNPAGTGDLTVSVGGGSHIEGAMAGIHVETTGTGLATVTVGEGTTIDTSNGGGILLEMRGGYSVTSGADINGGSFAGIYGIATGSNGHDISIVNTGNIGTAADGVAGYGIAAGFSGAANAEDIFVRSNGDIYSDAFGIAVLTQGLGGVTLQIGDVTPVTVRSGSGVAIIGSILANAANASDLLIEVGSGSHLEAATVAIQADHSGVGQTTVNVGDDATLVTTGGYGIYLNTRGGYSVNSGAEINGGSFAGVYGLATGAGGSDIRIINTGDIGSVADGVTAFGIVGGFSDANNQGDVFIQSNGDVYSDGVGVYAQTGGLGDLTVVVGDEGPVTVRGAGLSVPAPAVGAAILNALSDGDILVQVGDGAHLESGIAGVGVENAGLGATTVMVGSGGTIDSAGGYGILVETVGGYSVISGADVGGATFAGIYGIATGATGQDIDIDNTGVIGSALDGTTAFGIAAGFSDAASTGRTAISSDGDVYSDNFGILGQTSGLGSVVLDVGMLSGVNVVGEAGVGVAGFILNSASLANVVINVGDGSSLRGGDFGIQAQNDGSGLASVVLADGVLVRSGRTGIAARSAGEVRITAGSGLGVIVDDGAGGEVDGAMGLFARTMSGEVSIDLGDALSFSVIGDNSTGIFARTSTGDLSIVAGAGLISVGAGDGTDTANIQSFSAAIAAFSATGSLSIDSATDLDVRNTAGGAFGILAQTGGSGDIFVRNAGAITGSASFVGVRALHQGDGDVVVVNTGSIGAMTAPTVAGIDAAVINAASTGDLSINSSGSVAGSLRGLRATQAGSGSASVANSGTVASGGTAIDVFASGGAISVVNSGAGVISGGGYGIQTSNLGAGTTTILAANTVFGAQSVGGAAAIEAVTSGAGSISISTETVAAPLGSAIRTVSNGGAVTLNLGGGLSTVAGIVGQGAAADSWVVDMTNAAGGVNTVNIGSNTIVRSVNTGAGGYGDLAIRAVGGSAVVNNAGQLNGRVNFSGLTDNVVFTNSSAFSWHTTGLSVFSAGADTLNNTASGAIFTSAHGAATTWDFGGGVDTFANGGLLGVGEGTTAASSLTFMGLERWNNAGRVIFGLSGSGLDGQANDRIFAPGALFTGAGNSLLVMDVDLGGTAQTSCAVQTAADCLSLTGGSTAGVTRILVNDIAATGAGAYNPGIVLVDVSGAGSTAAGHFVLDPNSSHWRADGSADGVLDKGLFFYDLVLNGNKQHVLVGAPDAEAFEFPTLGAATQSLWHGSTGAWLDRQADLEARAGTVGSPGVWVKISTGDHDRRAAGFHVLPGASYAYDISHDQQTTALTAGVDLISGETAAGTRWLAGAMIGHVDSDVSFDQSATRFDLSGTSFGAYGTVVHGPAFVHALVAANQLDLTYDAPSLAPSGTLPDGQVRSWGFQAEGGYTVRLGERTFLEPLVGVSRVTTRIDALTVPGATVDWDDPTSLRLSLGGRIGVGADYRDVRARFSLTARVWEEVEAANRTTIDIGGAEIETLDDFGGTFSELAGTVDLDSRRNAGLAGFLSWGLKWNDDYRATETSAGLRYRW